VGIFWDVKRALGERALFVIEQVEDGNRLFTDRNAE